MRRWRKTVQLCSCAENVHDCHSRRPYVEFPFAKAIGCCCPSGKSGKFWPREMIGWIEVIEVEEMNFASMMGCRGFVAEAREALNSFLP